MNYYMATPEQAGVSSKDLQKYLECLEKKGMSTHSIIMLKGDKIFYENYWKPFTPDFMHRMYSISKSMVAIAVGFAIQDGYMSLNEPVVKFFPEELVANASEYAKQQTVRNALMMVSGTITPADDMFGMYDNFVKLYFDRSGSSVQNSKIPGTMFEYDSRGSSVLCAAVETVTGKPFMDYLREKLFDKIGVSEKVSCLKIPGGYSWGESGVQCTPRDLMKIAKFVMNGGNWDGQQLLNEDYLRDATSNLISSDCNGTISPSCYGYGYLIWQQQQNSFFFYGMGCQFAICVPDKELIFVYNGDNQGNELAISVIIDNFYDMIVDHMSETPLEESSEEYESLCRFSTELCLNYCKGNSYHKISKKINNKVYDLADNPMGIQWLSLNFNKDYGTLRYKNAQGEKTLDFGLGRNVFGKFPQEGYSDDIVPLFAPGNYYDCAASAEWQKENKLHISVQVIDKYFGRLHMFLDFLDETCLSVSMVKSAENFFNEYEGKAIGYLRKEL